MYVRKDGGKRLPMCIYCQFSQKQWINELSQKSFTNTNEGDPYDNPIRFRSWKDLLGLRKMSCSWYNLGIARRSMSTAMRWLEMTMVSWVQRWFCWSFLPVLSPRDSSYQNPSQWTERKKSWWTWTWNGLHLMFNLNCSMLMILAMAMMVVMTMVMAMMVTMMTWSMEQFDPNAVESFIMAGEGTKCCRKTC